MENIKNTTEITVEKKWKDANNNDVNDIKGGEITLNLYRKRSVDSSGDSGGSSDSGTVSFVVTDNNSSDGSFPDYSNNYPVGTKITYQITYKWWQYSKPTCTATVNGNSIELTQSEGAETGYHNFSFSLTLDSDTKVVLALDNNWNSDWYGTVVATEVPIVSAPGDGETTPTGEFVETIKISSSDDWKYTFDNLPLTGTDTDGNTVTYYYYVQEISVPNYTTSYENNGGITSGTITVTNKAVETPGYELPKTGGPGTTLYSAGGLLLMAAAGRFLLHKRKKRRKEDSASS